MKLIKEEFGEFAFWTGYRPFSPNRHYLKLTEYPVKSRFDAKLAHGIRSFIFKRLKALRCAPGASRFSLTPVLWD
jgi:hypothetical protein